ncbi:hypothetical protein KL86CLO1_12387 [uncultured Eubacteriales bacterium]|uniref:Uncharacterized protein n=1 Tax=uncultured Eubacteriales bacterium TaxID=172733 RepID=A0A212K8J7_9FIRM|nr:hypothetical protein KL86CLO1_12387 [uncultured Eubacteriales bacterium]
MKRAMLYTKKFCFLNKNPSFFLGTVAGMSYNKNSLAKRCRRGAKITKGEESRLGTTIRY